jgi:23S rRNA C2498 (ribose-2'-O)-methylase RlmM
MLEKFVKGKVANDSFETTLSIYIRFSGRTRGQMGQSRIHIFLWKGERESLIRYRFPVHMRIISVVNKAEFVSDRMAYIILRGRRCHIIVLNVNAPTKDKTDDVNDNLYEELESEFDELSK